MIDQIVWLLPYLIVGLLAGFLDALAGGGGLLVVPFLLGTGMPPVAALATNKLQGAVGTFAAAATYYRQGLIDFRALIIPILLTFMGAFAGSVMIKRLDTSLLSALVPVALICIALYFLFAKSMTDEDRQRQLPIIVLPAVGAIIGFYDGIFGPGTGSFFAMAFVALFGFGVTKATANTKVLNLTSNLGSLALFIPAGDVVWKIAAIMAAGQLIGAFFGARVGIKNGAKLIKPMIVIVSIAMAVRLLLG